MKKYISRLLYLMLTAFLAGSCEYDNYDEPNAVLEGTVSYRGQSVGVRTNGPEFELWQDGYDLKKNIPVYIAHDGTYSVSLFEGQYKLVVKEGGPWVPMLSDTLIVDVKGKTTYDVEVTPYFTIEDPGFTVNSSTLTASFTVDRIVGTASMQSVNVYLGTGMLTDQNKNEYVRNIATDDIVPGQQTTVSFEIPENLANEEYLFVRIGVRSGQSNEYYYTQSQKVEL
ncbi:Protein of unknown function [Sinomicrobium oceani]|uniref:DUF3823 domain-containing protein n=1 Tax=Sinomicrobium oceani TaxID=1150368 RepID=A0A1K1QM90_9FLAO|nr:DUF3823 domain-containing protein [Sinomicrobium oceani]SFW60739.1 Protein of unknown function [Sinomicrobium oceani]